MKIYWTMQEVEAAKLNPSQREVTANTMINTGGPVEVRDDRTVHAYQPQTIVKPRGMHFATGAEELAIRRALGEEEVIQGEVVEIPQRYQEEPAQFRAPSVAHFALGMRAARQAAEREEANRRQAAAIREAAYNQERARLGRGLKGPEKDNIDYQLRNGIFQWRQK